MKKSILVSLFIIISIRLFGQTIIFRDNANNELPSDIYGAYKIHYIVAFEKDAANVDIPTGNVFKIDITGLPFTIDTDIELTLERVFIDNPSVIIHQENYTTTSSSLNVSLSSSTLNNGGNTINDNTGIFRIQLKTNTQTFIFSQNFLVIEKIKNVNIPGSIGYSFQIHFIDQFFHGRTGDINLYLNCIVNALIETWQKLIVDWELANGLPSNIPRNDDNTYDIYITGYSYSSSLKALFHLSGQSAARANIVDFDISTGLSNHDRSIYIDSDLMNALHANSTNISLQELVYEIIPHEFYHGVQWSYSSWDADAQRTQSNILKMQWWYEGQAKALETVFMSDPAYNTNSVNIAYSTIGNKTDLIHDCSYEYYVRSSIKEALDANYSFRSIQDTSKDDNGYYFALLWRHIYENHFNNDVTIKDRLKFYRETSKTHTFFTNSLTGIKTKIMDTGFDSVPGNFSSFEEALISFAEKVYFHDTIWKNTDGTLINNWDDPNTNNFYTAVSSYTPPADVVIPASKVVPDIVSRIDKSFAFRPHVYKFSAKGGFTVNFNSDADGDNIKTTLHAQAFIIENNLIRYKKDFVLTNGAGSLNEICITNINQKLVILVTRLDPDEATISEDYKISGTLHANPVAAFTASIDYGTSPLAVAFTDQSTNYPVSRNWDLGDGTTSTLQNPKHEYLKSGKQNVKLIVDNCITTSTLQKNNFISVLPPYIETVEFIQDGNKIYKYKRSFNSATQKFEFFDSGSYAVKTKALTINVKTSLPLVHLKLVIEDEKNAEVYSKDLLKSPNADTKNWSYAIPANSVKIGMGINILSFSGSDYNSKSLINSIVPASVPLYIDNSGGGSSQPAVTTGIDNNYILYMDNSASGVDPVTYVLLNECDEYRVILANNKYPACTVDFGDGTPTKTLAIRSVTDHTYNQTHPVFQIKIYANGENVKIINGRFVK